MNWNIVISLLQNVAILLSFALLYDYFWLNTERGLTISRKILVGVIIGGITLILMLTPGILVPGIVFDTRSVILSISGLFFGGIPTIIAMVMAAIYRVILGGDGMTMGVAVIFTAGLIGILWGYFRPAWRDKHFFRELLLLGVLVHLVMLICTLLLPTARILSTAKSIAIPLVLIYIPGNILLGWFMIRQEVNRKNRKVNEKLVASERKFTEMLTNVQLLSVIVDVSGNVVFCNEYLLDITGYRYYEVAGKNWAEMFVPKEKRAEIRRTINNLKVSSHFEGEIISKDGKHFSISWSNVLLRDESGAITGIASIGENITDRKIAEENLLFAKEKAENSDKLKSVFLSNMSHEIRTPLNSIVGFSELLADSRLASNVRTEYYEIIRNSANKLTQIINDILDISKLETKQFKIYKTVCSLSEIMNQTFESFKNSEYFNKNKNIEFSMDLPDHLKDFEFESDAHRIQQVLDNLITNAIKYTEKGRIEFSVTTNLENGIQFLEFSVTDTGIGIAEDMYALIFERFRQVEEYTYHHGAGIGLSICKGIVELLGGKIWLDSTPGIGSKFSFSVPYYNDFERKKTKKSTEPVSLNIMNKHVIIAEDDRNSFFYLNALLKGHNLNIKHAENGDVLMDLLENETPDLILLDLNMPGKSGYECLNEIKRRGINTKVIVQTAYAGNDERDRCLNYGCNDFISKPIGKNELYSVLNRVLAENV